MRDRDVVIMSSSTALLFLVLLPSTVVCLTCYECVYPAISPLECQQVPKICATGERCLYSTATAVKDSVRIVLKKKSCATESQCGVSRKETAAGLVFSFTTRCCSTDLCNAAVLPGSPCWRQTALSLSFTLLAVLLTSL